MEHCEYLHIYPQTMDLIQEVLEEDIKCSLKTIEDDRIRMILRAFIMENEEITLSGGKNGSFYLGMFVASDKKSLATAAELAQERMIIDVLDGYELELEEMFHVTRTYLLNPHPVNSNYEHLDTDNQIRIREFAKCVNL